MILYGNSASVLSLARLLGSASIGTAALLRALNSQPITSILTAMRKHAFGFAKNPPLAEIAVAFCHVRSCGPVWSLKSRTLEITRPVLLCTRGQLKVKSLGSSGFLRIPGWSMRLSAVRPMIMSGSGSHWQHPTGSQAQWSSGAWTSHQLTTPGFPCTALPLATLGMCSASTSTTSLFLTLRPSGAGKLGPISFGLPLHRANGSFIDMAAVYASPHTSRPQVSSSPTTGRRPRHPKLIIIAGRCGRLANRITLFASFVAWAEEQGYRLLNPTFHSYAHLFEATRKNIYCEYPTPTRRSWFDVIPGLAPAIRKTRIFTHIAKSASLLNERWPI